MITLRAFGTQKHMVAKMEKAGVLQRIQGSQRTATWRLEVVLLDLVGALYGGTSAWPTVQVKCT